MKKPVRSRIVFLIMLMINIAPCFGASGFNVGLVPLDNRPVCLTHTVKLGKIAGLNVAVPTYAAVGAFNFWGEPDAVLEWLEREGPNMDVLILSIEMATTGGLVASRTDKFSHEEVMERLNRIEKFAAENPQVKIWAFGILQRIARTRTDRKDEDYVTSIMNRYFLALDEAEAIGNERSVAEAKNLKKLIPDKNLKSYIAARERNHASNLKTIEMASRGVFDLLVIGMDDNAVYGPHRKERESLEQRVMQLGAGEKVIIKSGADEIGQLFMSRAAMMLYGITPDVYVAATDQKILERIPALEDRTLDASVTLALTLGGARRADHADETNLVLFIHGDENLNDADAKAVATLIKKKFRVSIADVSETNKGSVEFSEALGKYIDDIANLAGYAGWNTASNTTGTAVAMLLIDSIKGDSFLEEKRQQFLLERFIDDVLYMGSVRPWIEKQKFSGEDEGERYISMRRTLVAELREKSDEFIKKYLPRALSADLRIDVKIPWFRFFEIDVDARFKQP
ncbi:MAG: DUF4127 family protein [bacterium]